MARHSDARDRLLATAAELVHRLGYSAVSVADICEQAGLQKGSFYHFFKSKHALVVATLQRQAQHLDCLFAKYLDDPSVDAREQLEGLFDAMHRGMVARLAKEGCLFGCPVGNLSQEMADRDPILREQLAKIFDAWRARLTATIERGVAQGRLRVSDPAAAAEQLLAATQGGTLLAKVSNDPEVYARIARRAVAAIEDSVDAPAPPPIHPRAEDEPS